VLLGWFPITFFLFSRLPKHKAVFSSYIGAWLFLPVANISLPLLPDISKGIVVSFSVIVCVILFNSKKLKQLKLCRYDIPMIVWCLCPIATSINNNLGLWDGLSSSLGAIMSWGIPYVVGRLYVNSYESLCDLAVNIIIGGLIYVPLVLYEVRMSPELHSYVYGFHQSEWLEHIRYGSWRPKVFMQHGLMVALWMALTTTIAFWLWRARRLKKIFGIPPLFIVAILATTTILCRSGNGTAVLFIGCGLYYVRKITKSIVPLIIFLLLIPGYIGIRSTGVWEGESLKKLALILFDEERAGSLGARMYQEDVFSKKAWERPIFGWGGWKRGFPVDEYGKQMTRGVDALWVIAFSENGYVGVISLTMAMLIGPFLMLRRYKTKMFKRKEEEAIIFTIPMSLVVTLFMLDSLFNGMLNPIYIIISGGMVSVFIIKTNLILSKAI
jgi:type IV secretory pathway VirB3-like protein